MNNGAGGGLGGKNVFLLRKVKLVDRSYHAELSLAGVVVC